VIRSAYLAAEGFETPLAEELARAGVAVEAWHGRLALSPDPPRPAAWAIDAWMEPREVEVASVSEAAAALRAVQRNWGLYGAAHHRRCALIEARLPPVRARALVFPEAAPVSHLGGWTLLAPERLLFSAAKTSAFVNGACRFEEDHIGPPSRAYLKLWEACAVWRDWPRPDQACLDLGASPGGWTWAIASLGAGVVAVDRAPLADQVAAMGGVSMLRESAFVLEPESVAPMDWLFSDIVAYPEKLLALVVRWIASGRVARVVCTVKFQGDTDHAAAEGFAAIAGGRLLHLFHNKHELTFLWRRED
jgi:23S rRNA (cytidine2498-2'-O)-methyltransferase